LSSKWKWCLALIACASLIIGGCQSGSGSKETAGNQNPSGDDAVTLRVWVQSVNQPEYFQWVKQQFEALHTDIKLRIEPQAQNALGEALDVTLGGSDAPDVVATWGGLVASKLYKGKRILEIGDVITPEVDANLVEAATYNKLDGDGRYVSFPLAGFASPVIYYNKTKFKELGLSAPQTFDELKAVSEAIRAAGKQPLIAGFSTWPLPHFMQAMHARTMTTDHFNQLIGLPTDSNPYSLPGFAEGFELLKKYNDVGIFADNITGFDANMAQMEFIGQNAWMLAAPSLDLITLNDAATFELGAFLLPAGDVNGPLASGVYSDVLVINAATKHAEQSKRLLEFLLTPEAQTKLLEFDMFPVLKNIDISQANPVLSDVVAGIADRGVSGFYQSYSVTGVDVQLVTAGSSLLTGGASAQQAAQMIVDYYQSNVLSKK